MNMPLYAQVDYGTLQPLSLEDWRPSIWEGVGLGFDMAWRSNPMFCAGALADVRLSDYNEAAHDFLSDADVLNDLELGGALRQRMHLEQQRERIKAAGLEGALEAREEYDEEILEDVIAGKQRERSQGYLASKQPAWQRPFSLLASFVAGALDPINIASAFVPVLGEQRLLSLAGSAWGAAAARGVTGMVNATAGAAMLEPLIYQAHKDEQRDYDYTMSLMNIGFAAIFGASLGPAAGAVGDWLRKRRDPLAVNPWEYAKATPESEEIARKVTEMAVKARLGAEPGLNPKAVWEEVAGNVAAMDRQMRALAYKQGISAGDAWARNKIEIRDGELFNEQVFQWSGEVKRLQDELASVKEVEQMRQQFPMLKIADASQDEARLAGELRHAEAMLGEAKSNQARDMVKMLGGDTVYSREQVNNRQEGQIGGEQARALGLDGVTEIEIAPSQNVGDPTYKEGNHSNQASTGQANQASNSQGAISGASLAILNGEDKPTRLENNVLFQRKPGEGGAIMGAANFDGQGALIRIFKEHDESTLPHELAYILRREYAAYVEGGSASPALANAYRDLERRFGVEAGGRWSVEQEDAFAKSFGKYLEDESVSSPGLGGAYFAMRERLLDAYSDADNLGLVSPAMRASMDKMLSVPMEDGYKKFMTAVADINTRAWEQELLYNGGPRKPGEPAGFGQGYAPPDARLDPGNLSPEDPQYMARLRKSRESLAAYNELVYNQDGPVPRELRERWNNERLEALRELDAQAESLPQEVAAMGEYVSCLLAGA